jgi:K+/H+ antiporter YhaU regulatory subunit KhtT
MTAPKVLWNKTLKDASIRSNYGVTVVWINRRLPTGKMVSVVPTPNDMVMKGDVLFVLGDEKAVEGFKELKV